MNLIEVFPLKLGMLEKDGYLLIVRQPTFYGFGEADNQTVKVTVVVKEKKEEVDDDIDELTTYYKKNISQIKSAHASEKLLYLKSILYNDSKNGNKNLWNKFVNETTKEERKKWYRDISYNIRGTDTGKQEALDALDAQIQLDDKKITQEEFDSKLEEGQEAQEDYYSALIEQKTDITGERVPTEFEDVLIDIGKYKPTDIDSATASKVEGIVSTILTTVTNIGMVVAILILAILGIKYMLGSVEEKADYKKDLIPYLIGACLLFGITAFVKILMLFGQEIFNYKW